MRRAKMLAAGAAIGLGLSLAAGPVLAHPYGPEDEHVNPSSSCRCDGCSDDWGSGGSPGYYADGIHYSGYPHRHHRRRHRYYGGYGYGGGYGYQGGGYPPPAYAPGAYPPPGYGQGGYDQGGYGQPPGGYYDQGPANGPGG